MATSCRNMQLLYITGYKTIYCYVLVYTVTYAEINLKKKDNMTLKRTVTQNSVNLLAK